MSEKWTCIQIKQEYEEQQQLDKQRKNLEEGGTIENGRMGGRGGEFGVGTLNAAEAEGRSCAEQSSHELIIDGEVNEGVVEEVEEEGVSRINPPVHVR